MILRRIFIAGLLGCTMLAGCNGDDNKSKSATDNGTFQELKADLALKQQTIDDLLAKVTALAQRVGGTETGMADLRGALAELTSAMTVLKGRVDQVETDIAALKALDARLAAIGGKIVALEATALTKEEQASVQTLTTTLVSLRGEIDTELNKKLVLADLSELTNKITALETGKADKTAREI